MAIKINSSIVIDNNAKGIFSGVNPGIYTTGGRNYLSVGWGSTEAGTLIWNSTDGKAQVWSGTQWNNLGGGEAGTISDITLTVTNNVAGIGSRINWTPYSSGAEDVFDQTIVIYDESPDFNTASLIVQSYTNVGISSTSLISIGLADTLYHARASHYSTRGSSVYSGIVTFVTSAFTSTGGTKSVVNGKVVHKFTATGVLTTSNSTQVDILYMAGSGSPGNPGGGCGAGGVIESSNQTLPGGNKTITIGVRGTGRRGSGGTTTITGFTNAVGGGGGGYAPAESYWGGLGNGAPGGSGGGGGTLPYNNPYESASSGGAGTPGQGFPGGNGKEDQGGNGGGGGKGGSGGGGTAGAGVAYPNYDPAGTVTLGQGSSEADGVVYVRIL